MQDSRHKSGAYSIAATYTAILFYFQFLEVEISTILLLEFLFYHYYSCDSSFDFWPQIVSFFFFCKITLRILNSKFNITVNIVLIFFLLEVWPPNYYLGLAKSYTEIKKFNHKRCISCRVIDLYHLKATKRSVHELRCCTNCPLYWWYVCVRLYR